VAHGAVAKVIAGLYMVTFRFSRYGHGTAGHP
jgi:hypothetical protein